MYWGLKSCVYGVALHGADAENVVTCLHSMGTYCKVVVVSGGDVKLWQCQHDLTMLYNITTCVILHF